MKTKLKYIIGLIIVLTPFPIALFYLDSADLIDHQLAITLIAVEVPLGLVFLFIERLLRRKDQPI